MHIDINFNDVKTLVHLVLDDLATTKCNISIKFMISQISFEIDIIITFLKYIVKIVF